MFAQAASVTLKILLFRAGPEDMPYSTALTRALVPAAVFANGWIFAMVLPLPLAIAMALAMVGGMALAAQGLLAAKHMGNRFNQTFSALLATSTILTLLLLPPFTQVAPALIKMALNPELLQHPENLDMPQGAVMLMNLLNFWNLAVSAHIFRNALGVNYGIGILLALLAAFAALLVVVLSGTVVSAALA